MMKKISALLLLICFAILILFLPISSFHIQDTIHNFNSLVSDYYRIFFTDNIQVKLNDQTLQLSEPTYFDNGNLLVPLRPILESCGTTVVWDQDLHRLTLTRADNTLLIQEGENYALLNSVTIPLSTPIQATGSTLYGPIRPLSEALSIPINWDEKRAQLQIYSLNEGGELTLSLEKGNLSLGDSMLSVQTRFGQPQRIDPSVFDFNWHVYNKDYRNFVMIGYRNSQVAALYTNSPYFTVGGVPRGTPSPTNTDHTYYYLDELDNNKLHAVILAQDLDVSNAVRPAYDEHLVHAQEQENFDCVNAFRLAHNLHPLTWNELAAQTGRDHSQDMANRQFFSHISPEGLEPWHRFENRGGSYRMLGENIYAGHFQGIDTYHGWINSPDHRKAILNPGFTSLGVGIAYTPEGDYQYYTTELFVT